MRRYGVHASIQGGLTAALEETQRLSANAVQIFTRSPRMWRSGRPAPESAAAFRAMRQSYAIDPIVVHTPYLPNLCTADDTLYEKSYAALRDDLEDCAKIGADYLVIHPGSYSDGCTSDQGIERFIAAVDRAFGEVDNDVILLVENMAGGGRRMAGNFEEVRSFLSGIKSSKRIGMCLDTAHTLAAGFPLDSPEGVDETLARLDKVVGLKNVHVIHLNDSKAPRGSKRDLHFHLGKGFVGEAAFRQLLHHPKLQHPALILETPKDTPEDDPNNLAVLRRLLLV